MIRIQEMEGFVYCLFLLIREVGGCIAFGVLVLVQVSIFSCHRGVSCKEGTKKKNEVAQQTEE